MYLTKVMILYIILYEVAPTKNKNSYKNFKQKLQSCYFNFNFLLKLSKFHKSNKSIASIKIVQNCYINFQQNTYNDIKTPT